MEKATKALLKQARDLSRDGDMRAKTGLFIAEGLKISKDMLSKGHEIKTVLVSDPFLENKDNNVFIAELQKSAVSLFRVSKADYEKLTSLRSPEGILAFVRISRTDRLNDPKDAGRFAVLCDGIQDPANFGAIVRNAVAFGVSSILLAGKTVDIYNPKVVRSSSGMIMDIPIFKVTGRDIDRLKDSGYSMLAGLSDRSRAEDMEKIEKTPPLSVIAFGSEGEGLSEKLASKVDKFFYIPISDKAESLNVSSAVAVALHYFTGKR
jgi:TrmH family RNA methyltransferase